MLENTVIFLASGMHGSSHKGIDIPIAFIGNADKVLKQNYYVPFPTEQQIANLHLTIMQKVFRLASS